MGVFGGVFGVFRCHRYTRSFFLLFLWIIRTRWVLHCWVHMFFIFYLFELAGLHIISRTLFAALKASHTSTVVQSSVFLV